MKNHSKLRKVIPLVLALAGSVAYASGQKEQIVNTPVQTEAETKDTAKGLENTVDKLDNSLNTTTMDFMFVGDYMHKISRNEKKTDLNALIKGGNITRIYAISPQEAFEREIRFLNSEEGKKFYASKGQKDQRLYLIGRFQNFLNELKKQGISPSAKSLEGLSYSVMDGEMTPEELKNVEDNLYCIVKEGYDKKEGNYTVYYLTALTSETTPSQYQTKIKELENTYNDLVKKEETKTIPKKEKDYRGFYLQAQQTVNGDVNSLTTSLGAKWKPFKEVDIGFGANLDLGFGEDKLIEEYTGQLSGGRTAYGTMTDTNKFSIGCSLEGQFGPLLAGGGIDYKSWIQNVVEQIKDNSGNILNSSTNAVPNRQVFGKVYTGVEMPIGDALRLGMIVGYNMKDGTYFGFRAGLKIK
jgi:hypothetical protein